MIRSRRLTALCATLLTISTTGLSGQAPALAQPVPEVTDETPAYAPMVPFENFTHTLMRGEWTGDNGETVVDVSKGEMILDGRAFQGTHRIEGSAYGGRTIIFYDEAAQGYIYHYFTTAGFHTTGTIDITDQGYTASEKVQGHPTIAQVASSLTIVGDTHLVDVKYQSHDGVWSDAPRRTYRPYEGPAPFETDDE